MAPRNKFHAKKIYECATCRTQPLRPTECCGERVAKFDSKGEHMRWCDLRLMEKAGEIRALERQVPLEFKIDGKRMFRYIADFCYFQGGERIYEDFKGYDTPLSKLKRKIIEAHYHVKILITK